MKKIMTILLSAVLLSTMLTGLAGCGKKNEDKFEFSFSDAGGGKTLEIKNGNSTWRSSPGVFGVRLSYDDISDVSDTEYVYYSSVESVGGVTVAVAEIQTEDGSHFRTDDAYIMRADGLEVSRRIKVINAGSAEGFMFYFPLRDADKTPVTERKWFAPSNFYGNDEITFTGIGVKSGFSGESIVPADVISAPVVLNWHNGYSFSITDKTEGRRETIVQDCHADMSAIYVDPAFNIPGIGLRDTEEVNGEVEMYHVYPCETYNYINVRPFTHIYRMLPIEEGLEREVAFTVNIEKKSTFDGAIESGWRNAYNAYKVQDSRYSPYEVFEAAANSVHNSYAVKNDIPQYMTNTDHYFPESGFLYRNADLGYLMIKAGYVLGKQEMIDRGIEVIDSQVKGDYIDKNMYFEFDRSIAEGLESVTEAYAYLKEKGIVRNDWLAYLLKKEEDCLKRDSLMYFPFLLRFGEIMNSTDNLHHAKERIAKAETAHNNFYFSGAIVNFAGTVMMEKEAAAIFMRVYMQLYAYFNDAKYLELAKKAATVCETYTLIQPVSLETADGTGYEYREELDNRFREYGGIGNGHVMPYGLSYISGQTSSVDVYNIYAARDFRTLSSVSGDTHYDEFADYLLTNCLLTVNMGDKNYIMDDIRYSSGKGFMNEYMGIGASTDSVASGRGSMHISNLAWNEFVLIHALLSEYERNSSFFEKAARPFNVATHKYITASSAAGGAFRAYNATDNSAETAWAPAAGDVSPNLVIDLAEFVELKSATLKGNNLICRIEGSKDGVTYVKLADNSGGTSNIDGLYRYIRIAVENASGVMLYDAEIMGIPVSGSDAAMSGTVTVDSNPNGAAGINDWNYGTAWTASGKNGTVTLDLGAVKKILETAVTFNHDVVFLNQDNISVPLPDVKYSYKIEISSDGISWSEYVDCSDKWQQKAVFSDKLYGEARYVRLTAETDSGKLKVTDFKVRTV